MIEMRLCEFLNPFLSPVFLYWNRANVRSIGTSVMKQFTVSSDLVRVVDGIDYVQIM